MELIKNAFGKDFWKRVREEKVYEGFRKELFDFLSLYENAEIPNLTYSDFKLFFVTGNRTVYQKKYFLKRKMLSHFALLSLIYPEENKYTDRLNDVIYAICDEYTWCLPAHQPSLEENNNTHLDLFACESGYALAEISTLLADKLDTLIKNRIDAEIERRIVTAYTNGTFYWWEKTTNNWAAVCAGSIGCTLMLARPELFRKLQGKIDGTIECYLSGFKNDGVCEEGVNYWHYGFGFFSVYADMLYRFTDGKNNYFERQKVKKVAQFLQNMYLSEDAKVSFSDSNRAGNYHIGTLSFLKGLYPDDIKLPSTKYVYYQDNCHRWALHLRSVTWLDPKHLEENESVGEYEHYYEDTEWLIRKNAEYGFAAKGGNNNEPHNHNDVGSFIIAKGGKQALVDLGAGVYTRQYFRDETRYGILQCSSRGHSLPIINGEYQKYGKNYKAKSVRYEDGVFSLDIADAYGIDELKSLVRTFTFGEKKIMLTDRYEAEEKCEIAERFVSIREPRKATDGRVEIDGVTLVYDPSVCEVSFANEPSFSNDAMDKDGLVYFTDFKLKDGVKEFRIEFVM